MKRYGLWQPLWVIALCIWIIMVVVGILRTGPRYSGVVVFTNIFVTDWIDTERIDPLWVDGEQYFYAYEEGWSKYVKDGGHISVHKA